MPIKYINKKIIIENLDEIKQEIDNLELETEKKIDNYKKEIEELKIELNLLKEEKIEEDLILIKDDLYEEIIFKYKKIIELLKNEKLFDKI